MPNDGSASAKGLNDMRPLYCWRCRCEIPMLDETEYALFVNEVFLKPSGISRDKTPEDRHRIHEDARRHALDLYFKLTGLRETNVNAVYHHRLSIYGPPCGWCGKPLRTPKAKVCAACWTPVTSLGGAE